MKRILFFLVLLFFALPLYSVFAQGGLVPCGGEGQAPCGLCHIFVLFDNIIDFVLWKFVPPLAVLMLVIGGAMLFFSGGDPGLLGRGKSVMTSVVMGLVFVYSAWLIITLFFTWIGVNTWTGLYKEGWATINCSI